MGKDGLRATQAVRLSVLSAPSGVQQPEQVVLRGARHHHREVRYPPSRRVRQGAAMLQQPHYQPDSLPAGVRFTHLSVFAVQAGDGNDASGVSRAGDTLAYCPRCIIKGIDTGIKDKEIVCKEKVYTDEKNIDYTTGRYAGDPDPLGTAGHYHPDPRPQAGGGQSHQGHQGTLPRGQY